MSKKPVQVRAGQYEFLKVNAARWDWRDLYHWVLTLNWAAFAGLVLAIYVVINLFFALLYVAGGRCVAELPPGSYLDAFFFSVETLATVGYGHAYPDTLYGHLVATAEIMTGMFGLAVITGLIFVRFSRPTARILFSRTLVLSRFDGRPTLMLRVANLRHHSMVEAEFRLMLIRDWETEEGETVRRFQPLALHFDRLIMFPAALTLRHTIDQTSPLHGLTEPGALAGCHARFMASVTCVDTVIPAPVQSQFGYSWNEIQHGRRFVEIYTELSDNQLMVDYGRIHDTEPVTTPSPEPGAVPHAATAASA